MANIFLSQALQAAGKPIVSAIGQRSSEQQKFTQMRNALLAERQQLEAQKQNAYAQLMKLDNAEEQLPEGINNLNALVALSATGGVDPNTVGKAAAELAQTSQAVSQGRNVLTAQLQEVEGRINYLDNQPAIRGIMSGDVKTEAGLAGVSAVRYPSGENVEHDYEIVKDIKSGDKSLTVLLDTKTGTMKYVAEGGKEINESQARMWEGQINDEKEFYRRWKDQAKPLVDDVLRQYGVDKENDVVELMKTLVLNNASKEEAKKVASSMAIGRWPEIEKEAQKYEDPVRRAEFIRLKKIEFANAIEKAWDDALDATKNTYFAGSPVRSRSPYLFTDKPREIDLT